MKRKLRKMAVVLAALAMCFGAAGCKKETDNPVPTGNVYVPTFSEVQGDIQWISSVMAQGNNIVLTGESYNYETYESKQQMMTIDMTTGEKSTVEMNAGGSSDAAQSRSIQNVTLYKDGYLAVVYSYTEPTEEEINSGIYDVETSYEIVQYDKEFNELSRISLQSIQEKVEEENGWFNLGYMVADAEGNIYFTCDRLLYVIDSAGSEICKIEFENWIQSIMASGDGQVLVMYYDENYDMLLAPVDIKAKAMGEPLENLPIGRNGSGAIYPAAGGKLYMNSDTKLYLYDIAAQTSEEILDWIACDINTSNLNGFAAMEDGSFVAVSVNYDYSDDTPKTTIELASIKEVPASSVKQKKQLTLAMLSMDYSVKEQIIKFNRTNGEYRIAIKTYVNEDYSNYEEAQTLFNSDLATGNAADFFILSTSGSGASISNLAAKGAVVDLKEFIEKDEDIKLEDFIPNIIDAISIDGKLYGIGESFSVMTLVGKTEDVGNGKSWTFKDVLELMKKHPDAQLMRDSTKTDILRMMLSYSMETFYDPATGACSFASDDFVALLELCNTFPAEYQYDPDNYESTTKLLRSGKVLLSSVYLNDFDDIQLYGKLYDAPVNFIGYPTNKSSGAVANFYDMYCISSKSKNKDGAWTFIRQFLLPEYQKENIRWNLPINKEAFEARVAESMKEDESSSSPNIWMYDDIEIEIKPLSEEEAQQVRDIIYGVCSLSSYDEALFNIISEEAAYYFDGQKSARDIAATIQSRAQLYIDENR